MKARGVPLRYTENIFKNTKNWRKKKVYSG